MHGQQNIIVQIYHDAGQQNILIVQIYHDARSTKHSYCTDVSRCTVNKTLLLYRCVTMDGQQNILIVQIYLDARSTKH